MKLSVEEVQTVQKQQQEGVSAVQGMLECKGTGRGQSHTASSFVWLTWGVGRVCLGVGQLLCCCFHFRFKKLYPSHWESKAIPAVPPNPG